MVESASLSANATGVVLFPEAVQVWTWSLDPPAVEIGRCALTLALDERERAARFRFDRDRRRFTVCRGRLRELLGRLLDADPGSLRFRYGPLGKPYLADSLENALQFNVAHSGDLAVCAISCDLEVGVDIEELRDVRELVSIASRFFPPRELGAVLAWSGKRQTEEFLRLWTLKEAWLKATGAGIVAPLDGFEIVSNDDSGHQLRLREGPGTPSRYWRLHSWTPIPGFMAAIAAQWRPGEMPSSASDEPLPIDFAASVT